MTEVSAVASAGKVQRRFGLGILLALIAPVLSVAAARARTTVTTYSYNADGALTSLTTQVVGAAAETTYLTWDDFVPSAETPTQGEVDLGDGRLVAIGSTPGVAGARETFAYDPRDRLLGHSGPGGDQIYDYDAGGILSSSSVTGGGSVRFYTDAAQHPQVTNMYEPATDLWSAWLGGNRYVSDGAEQAVMRPRKDAVCAYAPNEEMVRSYSYDAFGASAVDHSASLTVRDNPFQYAGEYRDPLWGGYYLRGRWYDPLLPLFLSRDPEPHLNRYAYGGANPVMNEDPGGYSFGSFLRKAFRVLNGGIQGHFDRIFLAPLIGVLQIAAYPKEFWTAVKTDRNLTDVLLVASVAAEFIGGYMDSAAAGFIQLGTRFGRRALVDTSIGVVGSLASSVHGINQFDFNAFVQGIELTAHAPLLRGLTGLNVRSAFQLSSADVVSASEFLDKAPDNTALIFRQKIALKGNPLITEEKPWQQWRRLGQYHERLIAVTKDEIHSTDLVVEGVRLKSTEYDDFAGVKKQLAEFKGKFELVGRVDRFVTTGDNPFFSNPKNFEILENETSIPDRDIRSRGFKVTRYGSVKNNCQDHAYAVLQDMGLR